MKKRLYNAFASYIAVIFALALGQPPSASAIHDAAHHRTVERRKDAPRQRVKKRKKTRISYVCPMHSDIQSKSRGPCPKCLMKLVPKGRSAN
jgi:Heavy metal binding domain